jgi:hypothetical protein
VATTISLQKSKEDLTPNVIEQPKSPFPNIRSPPNQNPESLDAPIPNAHTKELESGYTHAPLGLTFFLKMFMAELDLKADRDGLLGTGLEPTTTSSVVGVVVVRRSRGSHAQESNEVA